MEYNQSFQLLTYTNSMITVPAPSNLASLLRTFWHCESYRTCTKATKHKTRVYMLYIEVFKQILTDSGKKRRTSCGHSDTHTLAAQYFLMTVRSVATATSTGLRASRSHYHRATLQRQQ